MSVQAAVAVRHPFDRRFFLTYVTMIWAAIIVGFGIDIPHRLATKSFDYPLIVHVHALVFVGWLALLTVQVGLVRAGNVALHRRLGRLAMVLVPLMLVLGPATSIVIDRIRYGHPRTAFPFMATQLTNVLTACVLIVAGLLMRRTPAAHKRLMPMGTLALIEPGLSRIWGDALSDLVGEGFAAYWFQTYIGTFVLMAGVGAYDLATRGRLHPAYVAALGWCVGNQILAAWLYYQPWWAAFMHGLVAP